MTDSRVIHDGLVVPYMQRRLQELQDYKKVNYIGLLQTNRASAFVSQEAQLMLTTGSTRLAVSRGQQTWYHSTCYI